MLPRYLPIFQIQRTNYSTPYLESMLSPENAAFLENLEDSFIKNPKSVDKIWTSFLTDMSKQKFSMTEYPLEGTRVFFFPFLSEHFFSNPLFDRCWIEACGNLSLEILPTEWTLSRKNWPCLFFLYLVKSIKNSSRHPSFSWDILLNSTLRKIQMLLLLS